jgi:hypothetical protein
MKTTKRIIEACRWTAIICGLTAALCYAITGDWIACTASASLASANLAY